MILTVVGLLGVVLLFGLLLFGVPIAFAMGYSAGTAMGFLTLHLPIWCPCWRLVRRFGRCIASAQPVI